MLSGSREVRWDGARPIWHQISSQRRRRKHVSGELLIKAGFVELTDDHKSLAERIWAPTRRDDMETYVLSAGPIESVGTYAIGDDNDVDGLADAHMDAPDSSDSESSDEEDEDSDDPEAVGVVVDAQTNAPQDVLVQSAKTGQSALVEVPAGTVVADSKPRRSLPLPGFMRRTGSSRSTATLSGDQTPPQLPNELPAVEAPSRSTSRLRLNRLGRQFSTQSLNAPTDATGAAVAATPRRRRRRRIRNRRSAVDSAASGPGYTLAGESDVLGLVFVEVHSASDLPRWPNLTRLGFDSDPFCIISCGQKIL